MTKGIVNAQSSLFQKVSSQLLEITGRDFQNRGKNFRNSSKVLSFSVDTMKILIKFRL